MTLWHSIHWQLSLARKMFINLTETIFFDHHRALWDESAKEMPSIGILRLIYGEFMHRIMSSAVELFQFAK
jgi:hypothetical protein